MLCGRISTKPRFRRNCFCRKAGSIAATAIVVGFEDAVREPIVAHELPDVLNRIELGRFRRNGKRDVVWDGKPLRDMPSRLIKKKDGERAGRDRKRDFLQMKGHGFTVAGG